MAIGYSGTPLPKKLGLKAPMRVVAVDAPAPYGSIVGALPDGVVLKDRVDRETDLVHVFVTSRAALGTHLTRLRRTLGDDAAIWVSWPKKASKVATDVTEDTIRELCLPLGLVDVKVCAVSEIWSGLRLVVRKELRGRAVS